MPDHLRSRLIFPSRDRRGQVADGNQALVSLSYRPGTNKPSGSSRYIGLTRKSIVAFPALARKGQRREEHRPPVGCST